MRNEVKDHSYHFAFDTHEPYSETLDTEQCMLAGFNAGSDPIGVETELRRTSVYDLQDVY
jgi:hypothetical protein